MADTPEDSMPDFRGYVRNPEYRRSLSRGGRKRTEAPRPEELDEQALRGLAEKLFDGESVGEANSLLREVGVRAVPILLEVLKAPKTWKVRYATQPHALDAETPLVTILRLLEPFALPEAVGSIAPFVRHPDPAFRKYAAYALGNIGRDSCLASLVVALADRDDYVRCYALMGIQWGIREEHSSPSFLKGIFNHIVPLLDCKKAYPGRLRRGWYSFCDRVKRLFRLPVYHRDFGNFNTVEQAPRCLLAIDQEKGAAVLFQPRYFSAANENLFRILEALNEKGIPIPLDRALPLWRELLAGSLEYFDRRACGELLRAIAQAGGPEVEAVIGECLQTDDEVLRSLGEEAQAILEGVPDPVGFVCQRLAKVGFKRLSKPQKVYYCVWLLDAEVRNGGFAQYFVNPSGNLARVTLKALKILKAEHAAGILSQAMDHFGLGGLATDHDERHEQLAAIYDSRLDLNQLDDQFYENRDGLSSLLLGFARRYKRHFGANRTREP